MLGELEDLAAIDALALEDGACIMQGMGEHMHLGVAPGDQLAVQPDKALALVVGLGCHRKSPPERLDLSAGLSPKVPFLCRREAAAQQLRAASPGSINAGISQQG